MCDEVRAVVCRCEDIDSQEIKKYLEMGYTDLEELKRLLRISMGRCQGKTCLPIVIRELSLYTGKPVSEIAPTTFRPPTVGVKLGDIARQAGDDHDQ